MGYVGLPLAVAFAAEGRDVIAVDIDRRKVDALRAGESYIEDVADTASRRSVRGSRPPPASPPWPAATRSSSAAPMPLTANREPDLGPLVGAARFVRPGAAGRPARRPGVHDLPGHAARAAGADPRRVGARGRRGLQPRLLR